MKKITIYIIIELTLLFLAILFIALSKVEAILLIAGMGFASLFFAVLCVLSIISYIKTNRDNRNIEIAELLQETEFDEVVVNNKKTKTHNDKIYLVIFSIVATIVCVYMFIYLLI